MQRKWIIEHAQGTGVLESRGSAPDPKSTMACHTVGTPCAFPVSLCLTCAFEMMSCTPGVMKCKCFQHKQTLTKLAFTSPLGDTHHVPNSQVTTYFQWQLCLLSLPSGCSPWELKSSTRMISFSSWGGVRLMMLVTALWMMDRASSMNMRMMLRDGSWAGYVFWRHL